MPPYNFLTNCEIQKLLPKPTQINGISSVNKLLEIKDRAYVLNLFECKSIGSHWIALYVIADNVTYSHNFGVEHASKEI